MSKSVFIKGDRLEFFAKRFVTERSARADANCDREDLLENDINTPSQHHQMSLFYQTKS